MNKLKTPKRRFYIREWQRTILLIILLALCLGLLFWSNKQYQSNFIDTF